MIKVAKRGSPTTTELRTRAASWSSPVAQTQRMAVPKNVLAAMESLEKKLTDTMESQEKKLTEAMEAQESRITEKMNDMFEKIVRRMDKMTHELKESFSADVKAMTTEIENMKKEMNE